MREFHCKDVGMPDCNFVAKGKDDARSCGRPQNTPSVTTICRPYRLTSNAEPEAGSASQPNPASGKTTSASDAPWPSGPRGVAVFRDFSE